MALYEERLVTELAEMVAKLLIIHPGEHSRVGDLVAVEMQDRQDRAVDFWIQELVRVPRSRERACLGLPVPDDASDCEVGIVEGGADRSYGIHVAQLAGLPRDVILRANEILLDLERHAPTAAVEPSRLSSGQQIALFPEASPYLDELAQLDVNSLTPLQAINKLYEWKQRYTNERR